MADDSTDGTSGRGGDGSTGDGESGRSSRTDIDPGESVRKAGTFAYRSIVTGLIFAVLFVVTGGLGFLVYRGKLQADSFLLLLGLLAGFSLGKLDASL